MPLQIVPQGGGAPYAPHRDLTGFFAAVVQQAIYGLKPENRNYLINEWLQKSGVTDDELGRCCVAFTEYMRNCTDPANQTAVMALEKAGFLAFPAAAQLAIAAKIGEGIVALYHSFIREAVAAHAAPANLEAMLQAAETVRLGQKEAV